MDGGAAQELVSQGLARADQIRSKTRKDRGPPSGEPVAAVVARGGAQIGFQQVSELIHVPGVTFFGTLASELQPEIFFAGAVTRNATQSEAAGALFKFLPSQEAAPLLIKAGLAPITAR
jgi:molybdate transport system substrate-binding protein